jgi:hypothetical protein
LRNIVARSSALLGVALALAVTPAHADKVEATGKAITGGALLGAEVAVVTEAIIGVRSPWLYASGIALAGGGGAVGGYYIEKSGNVGLSMTMLFAGMALLIPSAIVYLDATSDEPQRDAGPNEGAPPEPEMALGAESAAYIVPPSMVELDDTAVSVRLLPPMQLRQVYTPEERDTLGAEQRTQFEFSLFGARF